MERLLGREGVRVSRARWRGEVLRWTEIRPAMRAERNRRNREDLAPMARAEVAEAQRRIAEAGGRFVLREEWAQAIWEKVARRFEAHREFLWVEVPGLGTVIRSTVALERAQGADWRRIRHRRGQESSGEEMGRLGSLLPFWSNARCPWFVERRLSGANLWEAFAQQDPGEVRRGLLALPREGRRPRVDGPRGKAGERWEALVKLLTSEGPIEPALTAWAVSVGALPSERPGQ